MSCSSRQHNSPRKTSKRSSRRGMAVVVVLGLLAITLALSYSMMRTQSMTLLIERNVSRRTLAEDAADAALSLAIAAMHNSNWAGVDVPLSGNLGNNCAYVATFTTGDSNLTAASPNYSEFPYRVTITATGIATDPSDPLIDVRHTKTAVLSLRRRALQSSPSNWTMVRSNTVFSWGTGSSTLQFPLEVEGTTCILGQLRICPTYPAHAASRTRYLQDLNSMRGAGLGDFRPLQDTVRLSWRTTSDNRSLIENQLGVTAITDNSTSTSAPATLPNSVNTYRLYPGGKQYSIPAIQSTFGSTLSSRTIEADMSTNPLGVFRSTGLVTVANNVTFRGTLLSTGTSDDVAITGTGVTFEPLQLPSIEGDSTLRKLPALLVRDDLQVYSGSQTTINGMAMVWDEFDLKAGSSSTRFSLEGNLAASTVLVNGRADWAMSSFMWSLYLSLFNLQNSDPPTSTSTPYFPQWCQWNLGMTMEPTLTMKRNSDGVIPHWHDFSQPLFVPRSGDNALMWNLVRIDDASAP